MNDNIFGKKLKELRKSKGFTQQMLAEKVGVDEKHLSRIENGKYFPTYRTLAKLLDVLGVNLDETGLVFDKVRTNKNQEYTKIMQIINSAQENELCHYLDAVKFVQKVLKSKQ